MARLPALDPPDRKATRDALGRALSDLRISVTDRCNFRCTYCLPRDKVESSAFLPKDEILHFEEIVRVARVFVQLGTRKLRITGGEPLLRRDLPDLISQLRPLGAEIALTTNGVLLPKWAEPLRRAGVDRVTVSLDALHEDVFQRVCDAPGYAVADVLAGIDAAQRAGFDHVKVNCVVRRGQNEDQVLGLVEYFAPRGVEVRFIEYMDVGTLNGWGPHAVVSGTEILQKLSPLGPWSALDAHRKNDVARRFTSEMGTVGVISSVSAPFCGDCTRARLSADGKLFGCLFAVNGEDVKTLLRSGASDAQLTRVIEEFWRVRADRYSEQRHQRQVVEGASPTSRRHLPVEQRIEMAYIGG